MCSLLLAGPLAASEPSARFSQSLTPPEQAATGIHKLSADQLAVLDALVRRDARIQAAPEPDETAPSEFSRRLLPTERQDSGLSLLDSAELAAIDHAVARFETAPAPAAGASPDSTWTPDVKHPGPEIHGMISFTYGAGSGGASAWGGAMAVSIEDPVHGIALEAGYAEMRGKGPLLGRGCYGYLPDDPFYFGPGYAP